MNDIARECTWDAFCDCITTLSEADDFVLVLQDGDDSSRIALDLPKEKVFRSSDSGPNMVLNAAGLALNGKKPWIVGSSSALISRSYGQIREAVAIPSLPVRIVAADGGLSKGQEGASMQIMEDLALMRSMPNMNVAVPSDKNSVQEIVKAVMPLAAPLYLRLGQTLLPPLAGDSADVFHLGGARLLREGSGVTVCACGIMAHQAMKAAAILEQQGISAEVVDCYSLKPFPEQMLLSSVRRTGCCVAAEEHNCVGGLYGAVAECLSATYPVPVRSVSVDGQFVHSGTPAELREYFGLTWKEIVDAAAQVWALRRR